MSLVRDDYSGELDFDLRIKVYKWSENKPIYEFSTKVKTGGFSAKVVYVKSIPELLSEAKCVDRTECVLSFEANDANRRLNLFEAKNFMLLSEPKNSKLIKPNIKVVDVKQEESVDDRQTFLITLSSEAIAPFVRMDFKNGSEIKGQFLQNGFFIFDGQKTILLETKSNITEKQIKDNLTFKTVTDVK